MRKGSKMNIGASGIQKSILAFRLFRGITMLILCVGILLTGGRPGVAGGETEPHSEGIFASSEDIPLLTFPEGITSGRNEIYVSTFNVAAPQNSRIFVFNANNST